MTRVPDKVVEKRAADYIVNFNSPKYMCMPRCINDAIGTIHQLTEWAEDFETFTHESFHLYPGWDRENFALLVSLLPSPEQIKKQHEGVFCKSCASRCNDVSPNVLEDAAMQRGFRIAMESLREKKPRLTDLDDKSYPVAARELEAEGSRRFGVDWNKN